MEAHESGSARAMLQGIVVLKKFQNHRRDSLEPFVILTTARNNT